MTRGVEEEMGRQGKHVEIIREKGLKHDPKALDVRRSRLKSLLIHSFTKHPPAEPFMETIY